LLEIYRYRRVGSGAILQAAGTDRSLALAISIRERVWSFGAVIFNVGKKAETPSHKERGGISPDKYGKF
jgi:hypothetical protein